MAVSRSTFLPLAFLLGLLPPPVIQSPTEGQASDTLPLRLHIVGSGLSPAIGNLCRLRLSPDFRYAGGQRFVLRGIADAEQHFFVLADSAGTIRQLYWLQAEELLPGQAGTYDYSADATRTLGELQWAVNLRTLSGSPQPGSDRSAALAHLAARGYRFPPMAPRLRLVYVPDSRGRREFMIVYLEAASPATPDAALETVLTRAMRGLQLKTCSSQSQFTPPAGRPQGPR
jgi:hypothetical protein